jgi:serine/threonine protein kinase
MSESFTKLGSYRVLSSIGAGGMGAVFLAEHEVIGRQTVIKILHPQVAAEPQMVERFFNEARATNRVKHRGIVDIYDCGYTPDNRPYLVMEYLQGQSLAAFLNAEGRKLSPPFVAEIIAEIAAALGAAHRSGIVHRDLKPDNLFLATDDQGQRLVKVLDFGIAQLAVDPTARMTKSFQIFGTPFYMSPEQCASSKSVDHRADIYSLAIIAYEMMCGRPPFVAEGAGRVMAMHQYEPVPPPRSLRPSIPEPVERVLLRALAKDPAARYDAIETFARELVSAAMLAVPGATPGPSIPPTMINPGQGAAPTPGARAAVASPPTIPSAAVSRGPAPSSASSGLPRVDGAITVYGVPFPEPSPDARPAMIAPPITTLSHGAGEVAAGPTQRTRVAPWKIGALAAAATAVVAGGIVLAIVLRAPSSEQRPGTAPGTSTEVLARAPHPDPPIKKEVAPVRDSGRAADPVAAVKKEVASVRDSGRAADPVAAIKEALPAEGRSLVDQITGEVKAGVKRELGKTLLSIKGEKEKKGKKKNVKRAQEGQKEAVPTGSGPDVVFVDTLRRAQRAYMMGDGNGAMRLARQALSLRPSDQKALAVLVISACAVKDRTTAASAYARLGETFRPKTSSMCAKHGVTLGAAAPGAARPGSAVPAARPQPVTVDARSQSTIQQVMRRAAPGVMACAQQQNATGQIFVDVVIAPSGTVTSVTPGGVASSNPALSRCIASVVRRLTFPPARDGTKIKYPFIALNRGR